MGHSSCHATMADLDVNHRNIRPGGQLRVMRDTIYNGRVQRMYTMIRGDKVAKGMKKILEERGISTDGKIWNG